MLPLDLLLQWKVYGVSVDDNATDDCCAPKARRSDRTTHVLAMGVAGIALCCALPSLLAGGILVAAAGWNGGVWAAIGVAGVAMGTLCFRWRRQWAGVLPIDPTTETARRVRCAEMSANGSGRVSDCCIDAVDEWVSCPRCATSGPVVGPAPVRAHRPTAPAGSWRYCPNLACVAVFFLDSDVVDESEVITQVGGKALAQSIPVCFCFAHTYADIRTDVAASGGTSTIKVAVKAAVAEGLCACEHLNPSGECCLPDVHRAVKDAQHLLRTSVAGG